MTAGPIISFRTDAQQYARLQEYAAAQGMNMSEVIRRAVKWMLLLYADKEGR